MARVLLVLPAGSYRAQAVLEAARRLEVEVVIAGDGASPLTAGTGSFLPIDLTDVEAAAGAARELAARCAVDAVLAVDDQAILVAAAMAEALGLPHSPVRAVATARDKVCCRQALWRAGLPVPPFTVLAQEGNDDAAVIEAGPPPWVLKPTGSTASRGVIRVDDGDQLPAAVRRVRRIVAATDVEDGRLLLEGFIPGSEVAVEGLLTERGFQPLAVYEKPDPMDGPCFAETIYLTPARISESDQRQLFASAAAVCEAVGLCEGAVHLEFRLNDRGPWLLEVNPRSIGGRCSRVLRFRGGVTLEEILLRNALRWPMPSLRAAAAASGVMMIPVPRAGVLRGVQRVDAARQVSGIERVTITAHRGQVALPMPEGMPPYLGFIFAAGDGAHAVEAALREAHSRLRFDIQPGSVEELLPRAAAAGWAGACTATGASATALPLLPRECGR